VNKELSALLYAFDNSVRKGSAADVLCAAGAAPACVFVGQLAGFKPAPLPGAKPDSELEPLVPLGLDADFVEDGNLVKLPALAAGEGDTAAGR